MLQDPSSPEIATLQARSAHSQENRDWLKLQIQDLTNAINGSEGLTVRLVRLEERLGQQQRAERRRMGWLLPLVSILTIVLEAVVKVLVKYAS